MPATRRQRTAPRASVACLGCRFQKIRCHGGQPCERCARLSLACEFSVVLQAPGSPGHSEPGKRGFGKRRASGSTAARNAHARQSSPAEPPLQSDTTSAAPFSAFSYAPEADSPGTLDLLVPRCAQPFPDMLDPIDCGLVTVEFAQWLFDFYTSYCAPYLPFNDLGFVETRHRSPFLLSAILSAAFINTPNDHTMLTDLPKQIELLGDRHTGDLLSNLALNHLAKSLISRMYEAEDAIAVLIMTLWSHKRQHGAGPAPWPLVGHAQRMVRRGSVHDSAIASPLSSDGLLVASLDIYDHVLTLGYGRPLTSDRPPRLSEELGRFKPSNPWQWAVVAQSELVPQIRRLILSGPRLRRESGGSLAELVSDLNDNLDAWFFKWTSAASEYSAAFATCGPYTLILAHNVRLCLNLLPLAKAGRGAEHTRSYRLALAAAVEIVDLHDRELASPLGRVASLRFAPNVLGTILAHAVLCLQPKQSRSASGSFTPLSAFLATPSPVIDKYFTRGMELLRSDQWNQGRFTPDLARTLESIPHAEVVSDYTINDDWTTFNPDSSIMQWLEEDGYTNPFMGLGST